MKTVDMVKLAVRPIGTRMVESFLIVIAVALGTAVVVSTVSLLIANGQQQRDLRSGVAARIITLQRQGNDFPALIANKVLKVSPPRTAPQLSTVDLAAARSASPAVQSAFAAEFTVLDPAARMPLTVLRVSAEYPQALGLRLVSGSAFTAQEVQQASHVVILTRAAAARLFPGQEALGQQLKVQGTAPFRVIGVFDPPAVPPQPYVQFGPGPLSAIGIIPFSALPAAPPQQLYFLPVPGQEAGALQQLNSYATQRWPGQVSASTDVDAARTALSSAQAQAWIIAVFASGGIVIAAVNLANLMVARVVSRTRSITVMRALGASQGTLFRQYLTEVMLLGLIGGLVGVSISAVFISVINSFWGHDPSHFFVLQSSGPTLVVGFLASLVFCAVFGSYPALLASRIRPLEANRA